MPYMPGGGLYCSPPCKVTFIDGKRECSCNGQAHNGWQVGGQPAMTPRVTRGTVENLKIRTPKIITLEW